MFILKSSLQTLANFDSLTDSVVENNEMGSSHNASGPGMKKGTRATLSAAVAAGDDSAVLDFSEQVHSLKDPSLSGHSLKKSLLFILK